jgi:hypothetical protein
LGVTVTLLLFRRRVIVLDAKLASNELVPGGAGAVGAGESAVGTVGAGEFTATDDVVVVSTLASAK